METKDKIEFHGYRITILKSKGLNWLVSGFMGTKEALISKELLERYENSKLILRNRRQ